MMQPISKFLTSSARPWMVACLGLVLSLGVGATTHAPTQKQLPSPPDWPAAWQYRLQAHISGLRFNINARMEWAVVQDRYQTKLRYSVPLLGHRTQTSEGLWTASGLLPLVFHDSTSRREIQLTFDWKAKRVARDQQPHIQSLNKGAQDPLSVFFETGLQLAQLPLGQAPPPTITVHVVGLSRAEDWTFRLMGTETLNLPAGTYQALHWQRPASSDDKGVSADIWFAPALGYLPVRIRLSQDNGDVLDQQLSVWR